MHLSVLALGICFILFGEHVVATPHELGQPQEEGHEKRLVCNQDNVLRALEANSAAASPFCITFGHIKIPTVTKAVAGVTPTVTTVTSYYYKTYYPGGRYLESIAVPSYVSQYSATSVSSACSCLVSAAKSIVTASSTMTTTTTTTATETLAGYCASSATYPGAFSVATGSPMETITPRNYDANPYICCQDCIIQALGACVAWAAVPGVSCILIESPTIYRGTRCPNGPLNGTVDFNLVKYPDGLGGPGPCAGTVNAVQA